jgi:multidrug transporter EmrE-like cation transporter
MEPMNTFVIAVLSIAVSVAAQFSLKAGMSSTEVKVLLSQPFTVRGSVGVLTDVFVLTGLLLYVLGAIAWLGVLSKWDVSKAYPLVGLGFALTVPIGMIAGENITAARVVGVALICAGVWMVART